MVGQSDERSQRGTGIATRPPSGRLKRILQLPVGLHRRGLGWILGNRILIVEHRGRRTGIRYQTPVEVVAYDESVPSWTVVAAWGGRPEWFANIEAEPASAVMVAGHRYVAPVQRLLDDGTAYDTLVAYVCAHPFAARLVFRALAWPDPRTPGALRHVSETARMITFAVSCPGPQIGGVVG